MAVCPSCKETIPDSANGCPNCGERVIPGDKLQSLPGKTSMGQKVLIALGVIILIAIGFSFQGAQEREDIAASEVFTQPVERMIRDIAAQTGIAQQFGLPEYKMHAGTSNAELQLDFAKGTLTPAQASTLGQGVCAAFARIYVSKGYNPTHIRVIVSKNDIPYGEAIFNGNIDALGWEPAK